MANKSDRRRLVIWIAVSAGIGVILMANAHLVYVAFTTDPDCVLAKSDAAVTDKMYHPAKSGC